MSFNGKTNWQFDEVVKEADLNRIEKGIVDAHAMVEQTKLEGQTYTDEKVAEITPNAIGAVKKSDFEAHTADIEIHVTSAKQAEWDGKETPAGAQAKANQAEGNAKNASLPRTGGILTGNLGVDTTQSPAISLAIGDNDTGFDWTKDGEFKVMANNVQVGVVNSSQVTINRPLIVEGVNLKQSVSDGKNQIASAITGKGVSASGSDTFGVLADKIGQINTGKRFVNFSSGGLGSSLTYSVSGFGFRPSYVTLVLSDGYAPGYNAPVRRAVFVYNPNVPSHTLKYGLAWTLRHDDTTSYYGSVGSASWTIHNDGLTISFSSGILPDMYLSGVSVYGVAFE